MKYENKYTHIISVILLCFFSFSVFVSSASAIYYEDSFPYDQTGLTGGAYIECNSSIGNIVIVIPYQYKDNFLTFTTSGNLFNCSSSTINCVVYKSGVKYTARFPSFDTLEYRVQNGSSYKYVDISTGDIIDTNVVFCGITERMNENYYFTTFEKFSLCVQLAILFFIFLNWFLLHKLR